MIFISQNIKGGTASVANLASKLVKYFHQEYGSDTKDLIVWMSPSIKKESYILDTAGFIDKDSSWDGFYSLGPGGFAIDMQGYNKAQFEVSGVLPENIHVSQVDTAKNDNYWSHYQATTVKKSEAPPRFAVYCCLVQGT